MKSKSIRWIAAALLLAAGTWTLTAATITWDGGPSPYTGTSWNDPVNWVGDVKPGADDTALFSMDKNTGLTSGKVISLDAPQTISTLHLNPNWSQVPDYTIGSVADVAAGNTLTVTTVTKGGPNSGGVQTIGANVILGANSTWDVLQGYGGNNTHAVVSGNISGSGMSLTKTGNGLLKLYGANTYSGGTTISAGILQLGDGATRTGSVLGDIANSGELVFNPASSVTQANITGTGSLTKSGAGTLILAGGTSATGSGSFTITGGGLDTTIPSLVLANSSYAWNGDFTYVGTENLDLGSGAVSLSADRKVSVRAKTLAVGGVVSGARKLTKQGDGTLELKAQNTYSAGTVVEGGTLKLSEQGNAGTSFVTINNDGAATLDNTSANANRIGDDAAVTLTGTLNILGNASASTSETAGALTQGGGAAGLTLTPGTGQSALLTFASLAARNVGFSALYRGTGLGSTLAPDVANIKFTTAPSVTAYGAFAASDGIGALATTNAAVLRGVLADDSVSGIGKGFATYDSANNGIRLLDATTEQTTNYFAGTANIRLDLDADAAITGAAANTLELKNTSGSLKTVTNTGTSLIPHNGLLFSGTSPITLTGGTLNANLDANNMEAIVLPCNTAGASIGTAIVGDNITIGGTGDLALNALLTAKTYANGYIRFNNAGTTTLSAEAKGALILNDGVLKLAAGAKFYEADSVSSAKRCYVNINRRGLLDLDGISAKSNGIQGSGAITNRSETLATVTCDWRPSGSNWETYSPDFSGSIGGNVKLSITGSGYYIYNYTQNLSGDNTFTGGVTLGSAGMTLGINSPTALGTGPLTIGGSKINSNGQKLTTNNPQVWNNGFVFKGSGDLDMGTGAVTLNATAPTLTVEAKTLTIGGAISETTPGSSLQKAGAGTLVLDGFNAYSGTTSVNAGKLVVGGTLGSGNVTVAAAASLTLNGNHAIADTATLNVAGTGVVVLNNTEKEVVKKLILDGVEQPPVATYGAIGSGAVNESAAFSGKGLLAFPPQGTLLVVK